MHVQEEVSSCRTGDALTACRICMWDGRVGSDDRVGRICRSGQNYPMRPAMCKSETETQNWRAREKPVVETTVLSGATVSDCDRQTISVLAIAVPMRVDAQIGNRNWRLRPKIVTWRTPNQREEGTHNGGARPSAVGPLKPAKVYAPSINATKSSWISRGSGGSTGVVIPGRRHSMA